jgi:Tfp pilus assembly protein PilX
MIGRFSTRCAGALRSEEGFTMLVVLGVMLVTSALLIASFAGANQDVTLTHRDTIEKQAYYAAVAGVQEYEYKLEDNPDYWQSCEEPSGSVSSSNPSESTQHFEVKVLTASTAPSSITKCTASNPFESAIQSKGALANTFRIESTGCAGAAGLTSCTGQSRATVAVHKIIATFQVTGFLNYIYFTQFEDQDPETYGADATEKEACSHYRSEREKLEKADGVKCEDITFAGEDAVNGPMHTDDAAQACGGVTFGRAGHEPPDTVEINKGVVVNNSCGSGEPVYNTATKKYEVGTELTAPESDASLATYVESANEFEGRTELDLKGTSIEVTTWETVIENGKEVAKKVEKPLEWPKNGLIFVRSKGCGYKTFNQEATDTTKTYEEELDCGSVYVHGTYSKSLTIGAETDLIINGNIVPTGTGLGSAPPGTITMGLIASRFVRIYHPCTFNVNGSESLKEPWIYAAILSTAHSFVVDNYTCGANLGHLNVYGAIAQKFRGVVGILGGGGYLKDYIYDERLATEEPPYYLSPLKAGWKIVRETSP